MSIKRGAAKTALTVLRIRPITVGVPVIILNNKREILLGKRSKDSFFYPNIWGIPGGVLEYNETIEECGKREVMEELGVQIKITRKSKNTYQSLPTKEKNFTQLIFLSMEK